MGSYNCTRTVGDILATTLVHISRISASRFMKIYANHGFMSGTVLHTVPPLIPDGAATALRPKCMGISQLNPHVVVEGTSNNLLVFPVLCTPRVPGRRLLSEATI